MLVFSKLKIRVEKGGARKVARKGAKPRVPAEPRLNNSLVCREDARTVWFLKLLGKCRRTSPTVSRARKTSPRVIRMAYMVNNGMIVSISIDNVATLW